ncbi:hypothetical protein PRIC1_014984 [Phytophthora ramorum]
MNAEDATPSSRRRGCNCKKSGCLKFYCECFTAGDRCGERCRCVDCKNQAHNHEEVAQAVQAIEKRTKRSFRPSLAAPRATETEPAPEPTSRQAATTERKAAMAMAGTSFKPVCICTDGVCTAECPCLRLFGGCSSRCQCKGCQVPTQPEKTKGCSCKKSNCLKLYCECLAAQRMCDHRCNCEGCKNKPETLEERERAVAAILERKPLAFQPKVANGSSQHLRGCNCRKSGCMKNYCECHQAGVACTPRCACLQCRNTETFVSAKKMLVFAGVSADDSNLRANVPSQRKIVARPSRAMAGSPPSGLQTPTNASTQRPSALELLSRSAPMARSRLNQWKDSAIDGVPPVTPTKRPSTHMEHYHTAEQAAVTPTFAKRKYTRRASNKLPFLERIEEVAADVTMLPNVEDTVTNAYDARNTEGVGDPELTILSRSLLHTAMAVNLSDEEKETVKTWVSQSQVEQQPEGTKMDPLRLGDALDAREALSPTSAGLFCEEEYSEAAGDDDDYEMLPPNGNGLPSDIETENQSTRHDQGRPMNLSVMQERAVLQEFSVWLRNQVAGASPY